MAYDSSATRARLLEAAHGEFVTHGLAGARVERIAKAAPANKQAIYAYFGSKDDLFDAVLDARLKILADVAPFTPGDLPAYAGALFDAFIADPDLIRLTQWKTLERPEASPGELEAHLSKAQAIADAYGADLEAAMDALMIALSAAQAWLATPPAIRNPRQADETTRRRRHRAAVVAATAAMAEQLPAATD
ncbi:TetR/AcrR family transcriptional regulator [Streptomyces sp. NPDC088337]|uniref:TetR/AcrR family transcriptional regulator n=1 Tax=unclassified Streptomyces TaxID=2593676 RepID=UPI000C27FD20|nr:MULTISPECIES: TetR family transcriptional regulator [unclassified Streptomyces]PJM95269.1 TetR family transcriptional regulator [Streptomyces sp. CB01373]WSB24657.1 TetR family transcriptional regulator [Streptomyces sp. NBC_01788]